MASRLEKMLSVQAAVLKVKETPQEQLSKVKEDEKTLFLQRKYQEQTNQLDLKSFEAEQTSSAEQNEWAYHHAMHHLDYAILTNPDELPLVGLKESKKQPLHIDALFDHSGSMQSQDGGLTAAANIVEQLNQIQLVIAEAKGTMDVRIFNNKSILVGVNDYKVGLRTNDAKYEFNYSTQPEHSWNEVASNNRPTIICLFSDGAFDNPFDKVALFNPNVRAVIFTTPAWAEVNVAQKHANSFRTRIPESALYNSDLDHKELKNIGLVIRNIAGQGLGFMPLLPGRQRIGNISIPNKFLLPSFLRVALMKAETEQKPVFLLKLAELFKQIQSSCKADALRCFRSALFQELMSSVSMVTQFCQGLLAEKCSLKTKDGFAGLLVSVLALRNQVNLSYDQLRLSVADKTEIEDLYQRATTVSERDEIMAKMGPPCGYLRLPNVIPSQITTLEAMFKRMQTMFQFPEPNQSDALLYLLLKGAVLSKEKGAILDRTEIPVWRFKQKEDQEKGFEKEAEIDIVTSFRLLPGYLRQQQCLIPGRRVFADYTLQPLMANRLAMVMNLYFQAVDMNSGFMKHALQKVKPSPLTYSDTNDQNLSPFWLRVLKAYGSPILPSDTVLMIHQRLKALSVKNFLLGLPLIDKRILYDVEVYPGVKPFIDSKDPQILAVKQKEEGQFVEWESEKPFLKVQEITDQKEIDQAFSINLEQRGGYIRPTYLTGGKVTLWSDKGPSAFDVLKTQLEKLNYPKKEIEANMHAIRNLGGPLTLNHLDQKAIDEFMHKLSLSKPILETKEINVGRADIICGLLHHHEPSLTLLVEGILTYPNQKVVTNEIDHALNHKEAKEKPVIREILLLVPQAKAYVASFIHQLSENVKKQLELEWRPNDCGPLPLFVMENKKAIVFKGSKFVVPADVDAKDHKGKENEKEDLSDFECSISGEVMKNPCTINCGHTFEESDIKLWLSKEQTCPLCRAKFTSMAPSLLLKQMIQQRL